MSTTAMPRAQHSAWLFADCLALQSLSLMASALSQPQALKTLPSYRRPARKGCTTRALGTASLSSGPLHMLFPLAGTYLPHLFLRSSSPGFLFCFV